MFLKSDSERLKSNETISSRYFIHHIFIVYKTAHHTIGWSIERIMIITITAAHLIYFEKVVKMESLVQKYKTKCHNYPHL